MSDDSHRSDVLAYITPTCSYVHMWCNPWQHVHTYVVYPCTEKNGETLLTKLPILRRFRSKLHPSDGNTTDAIIVQVKRYRLYEKSKKLYVGIFFCPQINTLTILICHIGPPWSMVIKIILSSMTYSRDQHEYHVLLFLCSKLQFFVMWHTIIDDDSIFSIRILPHTHKNSAKLSYKTRFLGSFPLAQ